VPTLKAVARRRQNTFVGCGGKSVSFYGESQAQRSWPSESLEKAERLSILLLQGGKVAGDKYATFASMRGSMRSNA